MTDAKPAIVVELEGLIQQATVERSHYYVKSVCEKAVLAIAVLMSENARVKAELDDAKSVCQAVEEQALKNSAYSDWKVLKAEAERDELRTQLTEATRLMNQYWDEKVAAIGLREDLQAELEGLAEALRKAAVDLLVGAIKNEK